MEHSSSENLSASICVTGGDEWKTTSVQTFRPHTSVENEAKTGRYHIFKTLINASDEYRPHLPGYDKQLPNMN